MRRSKRTRDPVDIRLWIEERGGAPTFASGAEGPLRIDFDSNAPAAAEADWVRWFRVFEEHDLTFHFQTVGAAGRTTSAPCWRRGRRGA